MADGADFPQHIGNGKQARAAGKHVALKIRAEAVAHHRNAHLVCDAGQLPDLCVGQELRFVDHHTGKRCAGVLGRDKRRHVGAAIEHEGGRFQPDPGSDLALADPVVKPRGQQQRAHPALAIIV